MSTISAASFSIGVCHVTFALIRGGHGCLSRNSNGSRQAPHTDGRRWCQAEQNEIHRIAEPLRGEACADAGVSHERISGLRERSEPAFQPLTGATRFVVTLKLAPGPVGTYHRHLLRAKGKPKAQAAAAWNLCCYLYWMLKKGCTYEEWLQQHEISPRSEVRPVQRMGAVA